MDAIKSEVLNAISTIIPPLTGLIVLWLAYQHKRLQDRMSNQDKKIDQGVRIAALSAKKTGVEDEEVDQVVNESSS